jgi:sugar lactone lactonase YvrE
MDRSRLFPVAILLGLATFAPAAKVKVWHQSRPSHFDRAKLQQAVISNEGTLRLARQLKPLAGIEAAHVWDIVEDRKGNLYVATGGGGKIFKVGADGKTSVVYTSDDAQVLCLCVVGDDIYAGTGASGRVIRIDDKGQAKVIHDGLGSYVWSLAADAKGETVYAATGPKGRIFRLTQDGKSSVYFSSKQEHILCVAVGPDGQVYAGSDRNGLVYRINAQGKAFVLYQAPQAEIRSLQVTGDGVYVGTSAPTGKKRNGGSSSSSSDDVAAASSKLTAIPTSHKKGEKPELIGPPSSKSSRDDDKEDKGKPASAPSSPGSGDNSLFRIATDGTVREVFREKSMVLSLLKQPGRFFVGTGMGGQLFEVDESTKEKSEIARLDHGQILCMVRRADGSIVIGTGDPGKLYVLEDRYSASGTVVSEVFDAKIVSKWGSLRWQGETPDGTRLTVAVRSGNVAEPDDTWSDWSIEQDNGDNAQVQAPAARFVQYRITLSTDDAAKTPSLRGIAIRYATTNQAPEVTRVEVPNLDADDLDNPKKVKLKWSAEDPNEDTLSYNLYVRKDGWKSWVLLEEDVDANDYVWDTTTTPSGIYRLKVVASDRKDNQPGEALTGERVSDAFVVSHVPPEVKIKVSGIENNQAILEATGSSDWVRLTGASFSVNGKKWSSIFPVDGLFDSKTETFRFKTDTLKPGTYVVVLRIKDAAGNTGSADVVFTVQKKN